MASDPERKQSISTDVATADEWRAEAKRQDRSISYIVQLAWKLARVQIRRESDERQEAERRAEENLK